MGADRRSPVERLGNAALRAFPRAFRERHGRDLLALQLDLLRRRGRAAGWRVALRVGFELGLQGLAARRDLRRARIGDGAPDWGSVMDSLLQDARFAVRTLVRLPGFTAVAVLSLALGIGANAVVFSMVNAYLLRPLPYAQPDELVHVWGLSRQGDQRVSLPNFLDWRAQSQSFADLAAFNYTIETLTAGEFPEQISGGRISANTFRLLGVEPVLGRDLAEGEDRFGAPPVALLSSGFWRERYSSDPAAIGSLLQVEGIDHTVVGILPEGVNFPLPTTEVWLPRIIDEPRYGRDRGLVQIVGRLQAGVTAESAASEMAQITGRLAEAYPEANEDLGARIVPLRAALNFAYDILRPMSALLMVAVGFVLLIACANVANLMLSRASAREREIALRTALGAGRARLLRQLLTESSILALAGGLVGVLLARAGMAAVGGTIPGDLYRVGEVDIDGTVIGFTFALSMLTAVVFGLAPALRSSQVDLTGSLKEGGSGAGSGRRSVRLQSLMVGVEMSLAIVLLVGTALTIQSLSNLQRADAGFDREGVLTIRLLIPDSRYGDGAAITGFHRDVVARAMAVPAVTAAATVDYLPLNHETNEREFAIDGQPVPAEPYRAVALAVSSDYFQVMGIPLLAGRPVSDTDDRDAPAVAVIDRTLAERYWPDRDPVGETLRLRGSDRSIEIVGVAAATRQVDLAAGPEPMLYLPVGQAPSRYFRILVRTASEPVSLAPSIRAAIAEVDPLLPVSEVRTLSRVVDDFLLPQQSIVVSLAVLGVGALALAVVGVYGLMAFFVSQRLRDIGIQVALGATRAHVRKMIVGKVLRLAAGGVLVGAVAAFALMQLMGSFLYGVGAADPLAFGSTAALLVAVALIAGLVGARRATRVDPIQALRAS